LSPPAKISAAKDRIRGGGGGAADFLLICTLLPVLVLKLTHGQENLHVQNRKATKLYKHKEHNITENIYLESGNNGRIKPATLTEGNRMKNSDIYSTIGDTF
jgi:hypothetical protein